MTTRQSKQHNKQIILNHMLAGNRLSSYQAFDLWQITCFLQRISDLRADAIIINDEVVKQNGKRFKRYWVDQSANATSGSEQL